MNETSELLTLCQAVLEHLEDLHEAWRRGGANLGGIQPIKTANLIHELRAAIAKASKRNDEP